MSIETLPITNIPGLDPGLRSPDTVQDWMVLESFRMRSETPEIDNQPVTWLLTDRVLCIDGHEGQPNNTDWHISVAMADRAQSILTTISSIDTSVEPRDAGNNVEQHYVYSRPDEYDERPTFYVYASNGKTITRLPVENVSSTHVGRIDVRGIDGTYDANNEIMEVTCLEDETGYRHTIRFNRETGSGVVQFDQHTGSDVGWILNPEQSAFVTNRLRTQTIDSIPDFSGIDIGASRLEQAAA